MSNFPPITLGIHREISIPDPKTEGSTVLTGIVPFALREGEFDSSKIDNRLQETRAELASRRADSDKILEPIFTSSANRLGEFADFDSIRSFFNDFTDLEPAFDRIIVIDDPDDLVGIALDTRLGEEVNGLIGDQSFGNYLGSIGAVVLINPNIFDASTDRTFYEATLVYLLAQSCIRHSFREQLILSQQDPRSLILPSAGGMTAHRLKDTADIYDQPSNPIGTFYNDGWTEHVAAKYRAKKRETTPESCKPAELSAINSAVDSKLVTPSDSKYVEMFSLPTGDVVVGCNSDQAYAAMAIERLDELVDGRLMEALVTVIADCSAVNQLKVAKLVNEVDPGLHRLLMTARHPLQYPQLLARVKSIYEAKKGTT